MIPVIIIILSLVLDGILSNFLNYMQYDLSWFTPMFTLMSIFLVYPFYKKKQENYIILTIIVGLIFDLFYTNILFLNSILFVIIGFLTIIIYQYLEINFYKILIYSTLIIVIYEISQSLILMIFNIIPITGNKIFYKISHSILLNLIYTEIIYLILKFLPKKYKKININ